MKIEVVQNDLTKSKLPENKNLSSKKDLRELLKSALIVQAMMLILHQDPDVTTPTNKA